MRGCGGGQAELKVCQELEARKALHDATFKQRQCAAPRPHPYAHTAAAHGTRRAEGAGRRLQAAGCRPQAAHADHEACGPCKTSRRPRRLGCEGGWVTPGGWGGGGFRLEEERELFKELLDNCESLSGYVHEMRVASPTR